MRELCLACAGFALEFIVFYATGIVLVRILKVKRGLFPDFHTGISGLLCSV